MNIKVVKRKSKSMITFSEEEWAIADTEHFGKPSRWREGHYYIKSLQHNTIVGLLHFSIKAGVIEIITLIVSHKNRDQGIGRSLVEKLEAIAREKNEHKIYVITGEGWKSNMFYEKMGFIKTGELKNHLLKKDWVEYSKFI